MSPCGNYCAVGTRGGVIYLYNVQSGLPRGAFPASKALGSIKEGLLKQRQVRRYAFSVRHSTHL